MKIASTFLAAAALVATVHSASSQDDQWGPLHPAFGKVVAACNKLSDEDASCLGLACQGGNVRLFFLGVGDYSDAVVLDIVKNERGVQFSDVYHVPLDEEHGVSERTNQLVMTGGLTSHFLDDLVSAEFIRLASMSGGYAGGWSVVSTKGLSSAVDEISSSCAGG